MKKLFLITTLIVIQCTVTSKAQEITDKLQVAGKAIMTTIPENLVVDIPIQVLDSSYEPCVQTLIDKFNKLQNELVKIGVKKDLIKSENYFVDENYDFVDGKRIKEGFRGSINIQINDKYTPELLGIIIQVLNSNQTTYSINFRLSENQKEKLNELAIKKAISDAKAKAKTIAEESDVKLIRISKIEYDYGGFRDDLLVIRGFEQDDTPPLKGSLLSFNAKEISIAKQIRIEWVIKNN